MCDYPQKIQLENEYRQLGIHPAGSGEIKVVDSKWNHE